MRERPVGGVRDLVDDRLQSGVAFLLLLGLSRDRPGGDCTDDGRLEGRRLEHANGLRLNETEVRQLLGELNGQLTVHDRPEYRHTCDRA